MITFNFEKVPTPIGKFVDVQDYRKLESDVIELEIALRNVQSLISEGAKEGFNPDKGDWAERLFHSQQKTSQALNRL